MFQIGDKVVHPIYGAGSIEAIEERQDRGKMEAYYVIPNTIEADRVLVLIRSASSVGLRRAISREDAERIVSIIKSEGHAVVAEYKDRTAFLKEIDWSDPFVVAEVWRDLSAEAKNSKKTSALAEKVRKRAGRLLLSELCLAMGVSPQECSRILETSGKG